MSCLGALLVLFLLLSSGVGVAEAGMTKGLEFIDFEQEGNTVIWLEGRTHPGAEVHLHLVSGFSLQQIADDDGHFVFWQIPMEVGDNRVELTTKYNGEESANVVWIRVYDAARHFGAGYLGVEVGEQRNDGPYLEFLGEFYLEGETSGGYRYTMAGDIDPEPSPTFRYPIVGDFSTRERRSESHTPIHVKVQRDQTKLLWGDFRTDFLLGGDLWSYNRQLTGAQLELSGGGWQANIGHSATKTRSHTDVLSGKGVAGFYYLTYAPLVVGSEQVQLRTIDRFDGDTVVDVQMMVGGVDYDLDARRGMLVFRRPIPMQDAAGNPVYVWVTYEYSVGEASNIVMGSLGYADEQTRVQMSAVQEDKKHLIGTVVEVPLGENQRVRGEVAVSGVHDEQGSAWLVGWRGDVGDVSLDLVHSAKQAQYSTDLIAPNGFDSRVTEGRLTWDRGPWRFAALVSEVDADGDAFTERMNKQEFEISKDFEKISTTSRFTRKATQRSGDVDDVETALWGGVRYRLSEKTTMGVGRREVLRDRERSHWDLSLSQQIRPGITGTLTGQLRDNGVYSAVAVLESTVDSPDGSVTAFGTKGELDTAEDGWLVQTSQTITSTLPVTKDLAVDIHLERRTRPDANPENAGSVGFHYVMGDSPHRVTGTFQWRADATWLDRLGQLGVHGRFSPGLTYGIQYRFAENQVDDGDVRQVQTALASLAYRPVANHRTSVLGLWRLDHGQPIGVFGLDDQWVATLSAEAAAWITDRLEVGAKVAMRSVEETVQLMPTTESKTVLGQLRGSYRIAPRWDVIGSVRRLTQKDSDSSRRSYAYGISYHLAPDAGIRVEAGYRGEGYDAWSDDPSRPAQDTDGGWYMRLMVVF